MAEPRCQTTENPPEFTAVDSYVSFTRIVNTQIIYHKSINMKFLLSLRRLLRFLLHNGDPGDTVLKMLSGKELSPRRWWF